MLPEGDLNLLIEIYRAGSVDKREFRIRHEDARDSRQALNFITP